MTTTDPSIGAQRTGDPRGWLLFESLPDDLARGEDSRLAADREHVRDTGEDSFVRLATSTECALLEHIGYTLPLSLLTVVCWLSAGVRRRRWPTLESQEPTT